MTITIFGTGYFGLVQAAVPADAAHEVFCIDTDAAKIADLEQGIILTYGPGPESIGRLSF